MAQERVYLWSFKGSLNFSSIQSGEMFTTHHSLEIWVISNKIPERNVLFQAALLCQRKDEMILVSAV